MAKKINEFLLVTIMNEAFGNARGTRSDFENTALRSYPPTPVHPEKWDRLENQMKNVMDEINELHEAILSGDTKKVRDALCDIRVFAYGGLHFLAYEDDNHVNWKIDASMPIARMLSRINPITALTAIWQYTMIAIMEREWANTLLHTRTIIWLTQHVSETLGLDKAQQEQDMEAVINGVMTRFIKDDIDLARTIDKFKAKGVETFYTEGEFPTMILKSNGDYPDAPKGKFLKAVSYKDTVFTEVQNEEAIKLVLQTL